MKRQQIKSSRGREIKPEREETAKGQDQGGIKNKGKNEKVLRSTAIRKRENEPEQGRGAKERREIKHSGRGRRQKEI